MENVAEERVADRDSVRVRDTVCVAVLEYEPVGGVQL